MVKSFVFRCVFFVQICLLRISYWFYSLRGVELNKKGVVVGLEENASILHDLQSSLPQSIGVLRQSNKYYSKDYDYDLSSFGLLHYFITPVLLAKFVAAGCKVFVYVGGSGYLINRIDGRSLELKFLKSVGCTVVCYFTGSDIRSFVRMNEYGNKNDIDVITTYQALLNQEIDSKVSENIRRMLAESADLYADHVFNPSTDQMSYMVNQTLPFLYFYPDDKITFIPDKWINVEKIIVCHASSSPIIKGTPLVRAAIKKLRGEGYDFEYFELVGVSNTVVIQALERSHIVLNEFYAFVPGVFGVEAMAANAVLLTSADSIHEPTLFDGANEAWIVTPYWLVYDKLKAQLDKPAIELQIQADRGTSWVKRYCSYSFSAGYLTNVIDGKHD